MLPLTWSERVSAPIKKRLLKSAYKRFFNAAPNLVGTGECMLINAFLSNLGCTGRVRI